MKNRSIAIIPARGGSKRIPRKNIKEFLGKPMIYYSIKAALDSLAFDEVMVSTDDEEIAELSKSFGAGVPFLRSAETSSDHASTADVIWEVIHEYQKIGKEFDSFCCIYPTAPLLTGDKLSKAMEALWKSEADSLIPIVKFSYPPQRAMMLKDGKVSMSYPEYLETRSQDLEEWYHDCGQFYCVRTQAFIDKHEILTDKTIPFIIPELEVQDIDHEADWKIAEYKYRLLQNKEVREGND